MPANAMGWRPECDLIGQLCFSQKGVKPCHLDRMKGVKSIHPDSAPYHWHVGSWQMRFPSICMHSRRPKEKEGGGEGGGGGLHQVQICRLHKPPDWQWHSCVRHASDGKGHVLRPCTVQMEGSALHFDVHACISPGQLCMTRSQSCGRRHQPLAKAALAHALGTMVTPPIARSQPRWPWLMRVPRFKVH